MWVFKEVIGFLLEVDRGYFCTTLETQKLTGQAIHIKSPKSSKSVRILITIIQRVFAKKMVQKMKKI